MQLNRLFFCFCLLQFSGLLIASANPLRPAIDYAKPSSLDPNVVFCQNFVKNRLPFYFELAKWLPPGTVRDPEAGINRLLSLNHDKCLDPESKNMIDEALSLHSHRIGVILPFSRRQASTLTQQFIAAARNFYKSRRIDLNQRLVFKNSKGNFRIFHQKLAELVFKHQVSIFIGGANPNEARILETWAERLQIPALLLSQDPDPRTTYSQVFHIGPDRYQMSQSIVNVIHQKGIQKIVFLYPSHRDHSVVDGTLAILSKDPNINAYGIAYNEKDYSSMEKAVREIFAIDDPARQEELELLIEERQLAAEELGVPFDPTTIILPPLTEVDAIFIADHFKSVRHFVSIFKFFKVTSIPLLGNQQWRAPEILEPPEPFLDGAHFFDIVGSYKDLPKHLGAEPYHSEYFTQPNKVSAIDFKLVTSHAIQIAEKALESKNRARFELRHILKKLRNNNDPFFGSMPTFDERQVSMWQTFVMRVGREDLSLSQIIHPTHQWQDVPILPKIPSYESRKTSGLPVAEDDSQPAL